MREGERGEGRFFTHLAILPLILGLAIISIVASLLKLRGPPLS